MRTRGRGLRREELRKSLVRQEGGRKEKDKRGYERSEVTTKVRQVTTKLSFAMS